LAIKNLNKAEIGHFTIKDYLMKDSISGLKITRASLRTCSLIASLAKKSTYLLTATKDQVIAALKMSNRVTVTKKMAPRLAMKIQ
jgi:hypothetical protein